MTAPIDDILNDFQNKFGIKQKPKTDLDVFSTGFNALDSALKIGGIPKGKTTEISGAPGTGKTILGYHIIKEAQKKKAIVLYIDAERAFNAEYAKKLGINVSELLICTPQTGEMAMQIIYYYLAYHLIDIVLIDSIPALLPLEELLGETRNGVQAKLIASMMNELVSAIENTKVALICLNQVRHCFKLGGTTTPFNNIFGYYASIRIHLKKIKSVKKWRKLKSYIIEANIHKNRWADRTAVDFELPIITE